MFKQLFLTTISWIASCFDMFNYFILDESLGITLFHFFLFTIFISITIRIVNFIKQIQEVESENEKSRYQEWLKNNPSTPRRFR